MYIALIFVGIISLSTCRAEIQSQIQLQELQQTEQNLLKCPDLPSKQQFNATAYFRDVWYVVSSYKPQFPTNEREDTETCIKSTSQILENGTVRVLYTQLNEDTSDRYIETIINPNVFQNGIGKFTVEARCVDEEGKEKAPFSPERSTIIDTDYANYAVEHKCIPFSEGLFHIYLILNRKPYILDPKVESILNKVDLKLQDFTLLSNPHCAEI